MFELKWVEFTDPFNAWNVDESSVQWFKCLSRGVKLFSKFTSLLEKYMYHYLSRNKYKMIYKIRLISLIVKIKEFLKYFCKLN